MNRVTLRVVALSVGMLLPSASSFAEEIAPNVPVRRAASAFNPVGWLGQSACRAGSLLGLCAADAPSLRRGLLARGRYRLGAGRRPAAIHPVLELVKLFSDDVPVAEMGNMRIRLKIRLE